MAERKPIKDYYGTLIKVQGEVGCSAGFMVELKREPYGYPEEGDFDRLTPDQAEDLGERLIEAAKATRR